MFAIYSDSSNPGRPAGSRSDGDEDLLENYRHKRYGAHFPWAHEEAEGARECFGCNRALGGLCREHKLGPKVVVPGGPGPDDSLPCVGRWDLFDLDYVVSEAARMCASCPFSDWCFQTALGNNETGVWAGTSFSDRVALKKKARKQAA